jgi:hypothetical protein
MEKHIFDIGRAKYRINTDAFGALMELGGDRAERLPQGCPGAVPGQLDAAAAAAGQRLEIEAVFEEVMRLYREYARTGSMDVLVDLKCRLEEVSLRYQSIALAEEVLNINSCLPYERRVPR